MKLKEIVCEIEIDPEKFTSYALNPKHFEGQHKARVFESVLGYNLSNYEILINKIYQNALETQAIPKDNDEYGARYETKIEICGVNNRCAEIIVGWIIAPSNPNIARLTTLRVAKD
jgi:filamentous hemagglutinin